MFGGNESQIGQQFVGHGPSTYHGNTKLTCMYIFPYLSYLLEIFLTSCQELLAFVLSNLLTAGVPTVTKCQLRLGALAPTPMMRPLPPRTFG